LRSFTFEQLILNDRKQHERRGNVLTDRYALRLGDAVRFRARLTRAAYCFWIALRPDGVEELCFPQDPDQPPPLTAEPTYPLQNPEKIVYGLTDGTGVQAFVLAVSKDPLPSYTQWRSKLGDSPWKPISTPTTVVLHHDGQWLESFGPDRTGQTRGAGEAWQGESEPLTEVVQWLQQDQNLTAIDAWALPVWPRGKPLPER